MRFFLTVSTIALTSFGCASMNHPAKTDADPSATRTPADVYSSQTMGNTTITSGPGGMMMTGPNGVVIVTSNADEIRGTWTDGLEINVNQLMTGIVVPDKIVIDDFNLKMPDGNEITLLALTAEEDKSKTVDRNRILQTRAQKICDFTPAHHYIYSVETKLKWFKGLLIDVAQVKLNGKDQSYATYQASSFSGARYFSKVVCGQKPRGY